MLSLLFLAAALTGSLDVADRLELRARAPGLGSSAASMDLENALTIRLLLGSRSLRYTLAYGPRFVLWDLSGDARQATLQHAGTARVEWHDRRMRLSIEETGSYGGVSLGALSFQPNQGGVTPSVEPIPTQQVLNLASSMTTLASQIVLRRWTLDTSIGYQLSGGADAEARVFLPRQAGPFAQIAATWAASRRDLLTTSLSGSEAVFSSGSESVLIEVSEELRHLVTRTVEARFTLGVSEAHVRPSAQGDYAFATHPVVELAVERHPARPEDHLDLRLGLRLGPVLNRQLGIVDERAQATIGASLLHQRLTTRAFLSASSSIPGDESFSMSLVAGELGLAYAANAVLTLDVGARGLWQRLFFSQATFLQGTAFVGVTLRAPPARL